MTATQETQPQESFDSFNLALIKGANKVLDTLASVWKYSVAALLLSMLVIGAISLGLFTILGRQTLFIEGIIFLAIAAWIFFRNLTGTCNQCCTDDIPHWKRVLTSFIQPNNTIATADGQSVTESLMHVIDASTDWIRLIRRDIFSMLFWPVVATVIFVFSVYSVNIAIVRIAWVLLIIYVFILTGAVYYSVRFRFQTWQEKVSKFKGYAASALENL